MKCPACRSRGSRDDRTRFELAGEIGGTPVWKCLNCGSGLFPKGLFGVRVIPDNFWQEMQTEWGQIPMPSLPEFSGPIIDGKEIPNRSDLLAASMTGDEREQQETAWRALQEIAHYRDEVPTDLAQTHQVYAQMSISNRQSREWNISELEQLAKELCTWGYATRRWEENRFPEVTPARIPEIETVVEQSKRAPDVPEGAEVADASASLADGGNQDPDELLAAIPGVNPEMRAIVSLEAANTAVHTAMIDPRKLAPPPEFGFERQSRCWRFGYFTRCCEASAPPPG